MPKKPKAKRPDLSRLIQPIKSGVKKVNVANSRAALAKVEPFSYGLGSLVLLALILVLALGGRKASGDDIQSTMKVSRGVVELTSSGSGSIESARAVDLSFGTSGKVTKVLVEEGDRVKKGQAIAQLDRRSAELAVEEAEANLEDAENGVSTTGVSYSTDSGTESTLAADRVNADGNQVATVAAVYTGSSSTISVLSDTGEKQPASVTGTTGETGETGATGPTGATGSTGATGPAGTGSGSGNNRPGGGSDTGGTDQEPSGSASPGATAGGMSGGSIGGSSAGGGEASGSSSSASSETAVKSAELALEEAENALEDTVLRAPFSGTIVSLEGAVGDTVSGTGSSTSTGASESTDSSSPSGSGGTSSTSSSNSAFAVIQQLDALEMEVSVSEADINQIHVGQRATVTISSADDEQLAAKVSNVGLLASSESSGVVTYPVTVRLTQQATAVKPGMSATVAIVIDQVSGAITVPNQALTGNRVTVVDGDSTEARAVEVGLAGDSSTEILSGLEDGEEIGIPQATMSETGMPSGDEGGMSGGGFPGGGMPSGGMPGGGGGMPSPPSGGFPGG